jgi:multidrug efflux pump subunit AcrB/outer membrane protein TolC
MNPIASALRRPVTVLVLVIALAIGGFMALRRMPRDIFPTLGIPIIYVAQPYGGMDPAQMEGFLTYYYEYHFLYITGIEHVESKSIQGVALIKLQFHPGTDMAQALAETISYVNRARSFMPPGTVPPFVMRFDAGSVPVGDLVFTSSTRSVSEVQDLALNRVRPLFATLPGVSAPPPFGGNQRTIVIRVLPERLRAYHLSPDEVVSALSEANFISPSGNVRIGDRMPIVSSESVVGNIHDLDRVPIRKGSERTIYMSDIGAVEDGADIPTGYALVDGRRTVYIPVTKRADASTLAVVGQVKNSMARFQAVLPDDVKISYQFDQSPYVTRAIEGIALEGLLGALLTGLLVLLFLRSRESALIVVINIPLALMGALISLWVTHQTINIMTLGGLALAIGVLVDESTVTLENLHTHLAIGKPLRRAILDSGAEVAVPLLISMLCVLSVFVPSFFMSGVARALFRPLSLAVGFSMVASYILSRTFVPVLAGWLLPRKASDSAHDPLMGLRDGYGRLVERVIRKGLLSLTAYCVCCSLAIIAGLGLLGTEIFPTVDTGQFELRMRAPAGTRIEKTEKIALQVLDIIKEEVGPDNLQMSLGFIGVQPSSYPINTIYLWTSGPDEAVLQIQLRKSARHRIAALQEKLRSVFRKRLPDVSFSFEPGDIVSRIMNLGSLTPIEVVSSGPSLEDSRPFAEKVQAALAREPSLRDVQITQTLDYPTIGISLDRERAGILGITAADAARSTLIATSSSRFVTPSYWRDPKSGIAYQVQVEVPTEIMNSAGQVENLTLKSSRRGRQYLLRNVARVSSGTSVGEYDRYNMQRMVSVTANIAGEDLAHASRRVKKAIAGLGSPPPRVRLDIRGQVTQLVQIMGELRSGLVLSGLVIFLLLAASFQSLRPALVVFSTVPATLTGVIAALLISGSTLNMQSFMGAIMAIGVAMANAILLVTFAERARFQGIPSAQAAVEGARARMRPIIMTSMAMIGGMIPLALALGEGGEQTAPLGQAVIGGLAFATVATLLILPAVFAVLQGNIPPRSASLHPDDGEEETASPGGIQKTVLSLILLCSLYLILPPIPARASEMAPRLTLDDAVMTALEKHPSLDRLDEERLASLSRRRRASSDFFPRLTIEAVAKDGPTGAPGFGFNGLVNSIDMHQTGASAVLSEIFDFGLTWHRTMARQHALYAAEAGQQAQRAIVMLNVIRSYHTALLARRLLALAGEQVSSHELTAREAQARYQKGLTSRVEVGLAKTGLARMQAAQVRARGDLAQAFAELNAAMGIDDPETWQAAYVLQEPTSPDDPINDVTAGKITGTTADDVTIALSSRPEMQAQAEHVKAAGQNLKSALAEGNPTARVLATAGALNVLPQTTGNHSYGVGLGLTVPLYTGGAVQAGAEEARHQEAAARASMRELQQSIGLQVTKSRMALETLLASRDAVREEVLQAQDAERLASVRYSHGLGNIIELQQAQVLLLGALTRQAELHYEILTAEAAWQFARGTLLEPAGKGDSPSLPLKKKEEIP